MDGGYGLKSSVIRALSNSMEPSLYGVQFGFNGNLCIDSELYRHNQVYQTAIMSKEDFERVTYDFRTKEDPKTGESITLNFTKADFKQIDSQE